MENWEVINTIGSICTIYFDRKLIDSLSLMLRIRSIKTWASLICVA